jgi:hypothetical protein
MSELERINKEWCEAFIEALNSQNAAIVFALGVTPEGKVRMCITTDITKQFLLDHLKALIPEIAYRISLNLTSSSRSEGSPSGRSNSS